MNAVMFSTSIAVGLLTGWQANIVMKDGRVLWVGNALAIALSPSGKTVAVAQGSVFSFLVVERIAKIEPNARPRLRLKRE